MRESHIEVKVCAAGRKLGWLVHPKAAAGNRGWPDRTFTKPGQLIFIEFKAPGEKSTPLQEQCHKDLRNQGYAVHVIDNIPDGIALLS